MGGSEGHGGGLFLDSVAILACRYWGISRKSGVKLVDRSGDVRTRVLITTTPPCSVVLYHSVTTNCDISDQSGDERWMWLLVCESHWHFFGLRQPDSKLYCLFFLNCQVNAWKLVKRKAIPLQARTVPEGFRRFRLPDFKIIDTWRWQGCQPYSPAIFIHWKYSWYLWSHIGLLWTRSYILISNFRRVLNAVCFRLGNSRASERRQPLMTQ